MCQQLEHELSLCHLNLILLLSSLSFLEGICHSYPGIGSACLSTFSYKSFQCDCPYYSMSTYSFHLCFSSSGYSSWDLVDPLETVSCLSFAQVAFLAFFFLFESTLESPETSAWSLDGLMVPIITSLSCSCVRDSMKSARLGIFQVQSVNFVA